MRLWRKFRRPPLTLVVVFALVGFLLVVTGTATSAASKTEAPRKKELINQIVQQRSNVDDLDKAVAQVRDQVGAAQVKAGQLSAQQKSQNQQVDQLALEAGTTDVQGPGISVRLSDAPQPNGQSGSSFTADRIQDSDVQLVVNALFAAGAEAVSINDNRVVVVTPIRAAGGTIVVNYRPVNSPYQIDAIGVDEKKFKDSQEAKNFEQWKNKFKLGFSVEKHSNISMSAYSGRVSINQAQASLPPSTTTTSSTTVPTTVSRSTVTTKK